MGRIILQRLASIGLFGAIFVLATIRTVLDLVGWSTAPDDVGVAMTRLDQFFQWLISVPWWLPWGCALAATFWLMWVSWPRASRPPRLALTDEYSALAQDCIALSKELLSGDPDKNMYKHYLAALGPTFKELDELDVKILRYNPKKTNKENAIDAAVYLAMIGQYLRNCRLDDAKWTANDIVGRELAKQKLPSETVEKKLP